LEDFETILKIAAIVIFFIGQTVFKILTKGKTLKKAMTFDQTPGGGFEQIPVFTPAAAPSPPSLSTITPLSLKAPPYSDEIAAAENVLRLNKKRVHSSDIKNLNDIFVTPSNIAGAVMLSEIISKNRKGLNF
jgi:hypothetical protein